MPRFYVVSFGEGGLGAGGRGRNLLGFLLVVSRKEEPTDIATTHRRQYSHAEQILYVAFELSSRAWKLGMTVGSSQTALEGNVSAEDLTALSKEIRSR